MYLYGMKYRYATGIQCFSILPRRCNRVHSGMTVFWMSPIMERMLLFLVRTRLSMNAMSRIWPIGMELPGHPISFTKAYVMRSEDTAPSFHRDCTVTPIFQ